jgi:hypothetical protein
MLYKELGCEEARWMALAEDRVLHVINDIGIWGYAFGELVHYEDEFHGNKLVGTGSGSCSVASFDTSGVRNSYYATAELVNEKVDTGLEIFATVQLRIQFFWNMKSRRWVIDSRRFEATAFPRHARDRSFSDPALYTRQTELYQVGSQKNRLPDGSKLCPVARFDFGSP